MMLVATQISCQDQAKILETMPNVNHCKKFCSAVPRIAYTAASDSRCKGRIGWVNDNHHEDAWTLGFGDCNSNSLNGWVKMSLNTQSYVVRVRFYTPNSGR